MRSVANDVTPTQHTEGRQWRLLDLPAREPAIVDGMFNSPDKTEQLRGYLDQLNATADADLHPADRAFRESFREFRTPDVARMARDQALGRLDPADRAYMDEFTAAMRNGQLHNSTSVSTAMERGDLARRDARGELTAGERETLRLLREGRSQHESFTRGRALDRNSRIPPAPGPGDALKPPCLCS
ncbi:MAG: hypothetical protein ACAI38_09550 [Myxococcota bacterium]|nr:hypothetical protein [Myxococcota bacterium]